MYDIKQKIYQAKKRLLEMHFSQKTGHLGGNLSALDTLMVLHHEIMDQEDCFILSKGHAAGALYITLWSKGIIKDDELKTFHSDNSKLAGHPIPGWLPQIPICTGSLGHGFSVGLGMALGRKLTNTSGHIYCLTSDGEWQEGSNWEALIFFAHHKLTNFTLLIDGNGLQGIGTTTAVASMPLSKLMDCIAAFNVNVCQIDGHDSKAINEALQEKKYQCIILNTVKGAGVSFMENRMEWHYLQLNDELLKQALAEV